MPTNFIEIKIPEKNYITCVVYNPALKNYIIVSEDFGKNWMPFTYDTTYIGFERLFFLNKDFGWAACRKQLVPKSSLYYDVIMKTTDGGKTWITKLDTLLPPSSGLQNIYFSDSLNGYALCWYVGLWRPLTAVRHGGGIRPLTVM